MAGWLQVGQREGLRERWLEVRGREGEIERWMEVVGGWREGDGD